MRIIYGWKPLTIFAKISILDIWLCSEYASGAYCRYVISTLMEIRKVGDAWLLNNTNKDQNKSHVTNNKILSFILSEPRFLLGA